MPKRSAISALPAELRRRLDERLVADGFSNYESLSAWLAGEGHPVGKSSIHRYGQDLEAQYEGAMGDARALLALTRAAGDLGEAGSEIAASAAAILQTDIVRTALQIRTETDPEKRAKLLSTLTRAQADVGRMTISLDRHRAEVKAKAAAVAADVAAVVKKGGLTDSAAKDIRRMILGIAN